MFFFEANGIDAAEKKRAVLLSVCGAATYSMLSSLVAPKRPAEVPYDELIGCLQRHFNPRPSEIVQRFHFHNCKQQPGQSISAFIAELRKLSVHCNFGDQLENMLRDQIVCGVQDPALQRQLLLETALTFKSAEESAMAAETAALNASILRMGISGPQAVHRTTHTPDTKMDMGATMEAVKRCFRCGALHVSSECKFSTAVCHLCKRRGHIAWVCMRRAQTITTSKHENTPQDAHAVTMESQGQEEYFLHHTSTSWRARGHRTWLR